MMDEQFSGSEAGENIAEYAVLLAVLIVIVVSAVHLLSSNAANVFSEVGSKMQ